MRRWSADEGQRGRGENESRRGESPRRVDSHQPHGKESGTSWTTGWESGGELEVGRPGRGRGSRGGGGGWTCFSNSMSPSQSAPFPHGRVSPSRDDCRLRSSLGGAWGVLRSGNSRRANEGLTRSRSGGEVGRAGAHCSPRNQEKSSQRVPPPRDAAMTRIAPLEAPTGTVNWPVGRCLQPARLGWHGPWQRRWAGGVYRSLSPAHRLSSRPLPLFIIPKLDSARLQLHIPLHLSALRRRRNDLTWTRCSTPTARPNPIKTWRRNAVPETGNGPNHHTFFPVQPAVPFLRHSILPPSTDPANRLSPAATPPNQPVYRAVAETRCQMKRVQLCRRPSPTMLRLGIWSLGAGRGPQALARWHARSKWVETPEVVVGLPGFPAPCWCRRRLQELSSAQHARCSLLSLSQPLFITAKSRRTTTQFSTSPRTSGT